jgi:hypothetical protein
MVGVRQQRLPGAAGEQRFEVGAALLEPFLEGGVLGAVLFVPAEQGLATRHGNGADDVADIGQETVGFGIPAASTEVLPARAASPSCLVSCQVSQKLRGNWSGLNRKSASASQPRIAAENMGAELYCQCLERALGSGLAGMEKRDQARMGAAKSWMSNSWPSASRWLVSARDSTMSASSS